MPSATRWALWTSFLLSPRRLVPPLCGEGHLIRYFIACEGHVEMREGLAEVGGHHAHLRPVDPREVLVRECVMKRAVRLRHHNTEPAWARGSPEPSVSNTQICLAVPDPDAARNL